MSTPHRLYASLNELLSVGTLTRLGGRPVTSVEVRPFEPPYGGVSGNRFLAVEAIGPDGRRQPYVVKRTALSWDLIRRITGDAACRELTVWQHRLLDRLPPEVGHAAVAGARDGDGAAILMRDIGDLMHPSQRWPHPGWAALTTSELAAFLEGLAALHAARWEDPALLDRRLGPCELTALYGSFSPATVAREASSPHGLLTILRIGWQRFDEAASPDLVRLVRRLQAHLGPLCEALRRYPWTLVHGDPNCKNFGIEPGPIPRLLLLDWQLASRAPSAVDLAFFLSLFSAVLPASKEAVIEEYRGRLAARLGDRFDDRWWRPQLDLALLGHLLRFGALLSQRLTEHEDPAVRDHYRTELAWWSERALAGAARL